MTVTNQQQVNDSETIDLGEMLRTLLNNWKLIVSCVFIALLFAMLYLRETRFIYSVDGLVQIQNSQNSSDALLGGAGQSSLASLANLKSPADTEIQLLKSRFVLGQVVHNLNLDIVLSGEKDRWYQRLLHSVNAKVGYTKEGVSYTADGLSFEIRRFNVPYALLNQTFELKFVAGGRYTLELLHKSKVAGFDTQPLITGTVGRLLTIPVGDETLQFLVQKNTKVLDSGAVYLTKKSILQAVADINSSLSIAERGKQTGVIALTYQGVDQDYIQQTLNEVMRVYLAQNVASRTEETQQTLKFLDGQLPQLKAELESSEDQYNAFREKNNTIDPTKEAELLLQQSVALKTKKMELEQQSVLLGQKYTDNFPMIAQIKAQVAAIDQDGKELEGKVIAMPELQRQYLQLYRDVQVNTVIYTSLLNSYEQLKVMKAGKTATIRILDQALKSSQPIKPQKALVLLLSTILGLVVSVLVLVLKSLLYSGVKDSEQIELRTGLPVIATVPRSLSQRKMIGRRSKKITLLAQVNPDDLAIEGLKSLRTMIHFSVNKAKNNIILITGPAPGIGKSFIAANFAAVCAQMGKSVILVDADMRRGHLNEYLNIAKINGLADYLKSDHLSLDDVCVSTAVDGLSFIAKGSALTNPSELLLTEKFNALMDTLSAKYDYVIIDSPPVLAATDAAIIARTAGMTLMVVRYAQTHMRELELSLSRLSQAGTSVEGIVFNDVQSAIGYGYQYAYQYRADK